MTFEQKEQAALSDLLSWLEDELRETKAQVKRMERGVSESEGRIAELTSKVHAAEDGAAALAGRLVDIPQFGVQIGQLRQGVAERDEHSEATERRLTEALRLQQSETGRLRQELNDTHRRIELVERMVDTWGPRFEHLEEADRRLQEAISLARQRGEELERRQESAELRATRGLDTLRRYEHDSARLITDLEALQKRDETATERLQAFTDAIRRLEQQLESLVAEVAGQRDVYEKIDLLRAELHRLQDRISVTETEHDGYHKRLDDHDRQLGVLEGKDRGLAEQLSTNREEFATYKQQVAEQFQRIHQVLDRQKRRQMEELAHDLRELKTTAFRPPEEGPAS